MYIYIDIVLFFHGPKFKIVKQVESVPILLLIYLTEKTLRILSYFKMKLLSFLQPCK